MNTHPANNNYYFADHPEGFIEPYLDGELDPNQAAMVEAHLADCAECQRKVEERQRVSYLLGEWQPASTRFSEAVFMERLATQLTQYPQKKRTDISSIIQFFWGLTPILLLSGLVFLITVQLTSNLIGLIPGTEYLLASRPSLISKWVDLPEMMKPLFRIFLDFNLMRWNWLNNMIAIFALALAYLGWLSTWWVSNRQELPSILTIEKEKI